MKNLLFFLALLTVISCQYKSEIPESLAIEFLIGICGNNQDCDTSIKKQFKSCRKKINNPYEIIYLSNGEESIKFKKEFYACFVDRNGYQLIRT